MSETPISEALKEKLKGKAIKQETAEIPKPELLPSQDICKIGEIQLVSCKHDAIQLADITLQLLSKKEVQNYLKLIDIKKSTFSYFG